MARIKGTRKFGRNRYTLKYDSATFNSYCDPDSVKGVADKRRQAKVWAKDYAADGWDTKITAYRGGKDFKVWVLPKR